MTGTLPCIITDLAQMEERFRRLDVESKSLIEVSLKLTCSSLRVRDLYCAVGIDCGTQIPGVSTPRLLS